jgi:uncharacterized protein (TIGR02569 family)
VPAAGPPDGVLEAFGVAGHDALSLDGGVGVSWRAGDLVLKLADLGHDELAWQARLLPRIARDGFRLAPWVTAGDGSLCVDGWCATEYVTGRHEHGRWAEIVTAGERLHAALRGVPRPPFLDRRSNPWAVGDRVAWGEIRLAGLGDVRHVPRLAGEIRPISAPSQLIHGDLTGNVLFDDRLAPAIIDLSPYWRPAGYASAIVVADALVWEGADAGVLRAVGHIGEFGQHLVRALIFRLVSDWLVTEGESSAGGVDGDPWELAVDLACELAVQ